MAVAHPHTHTTHYTGAAAMQATSQLLQRGALGRGRTRRRPSERLVLTKADGACACLDARWRGAGRHAACPGLHPLVVAAVCPCATRRWRGCWLALGAAVGWQDEAGWMAAMRNHRTRGRCCLCFCLLLSPSLARSLSSHPIRSLHTHLNTPRLVPTSTHF